MNEPHDLGLSHDLPLLISRRRALAALAGAVALAACGGSDEPAATTTQTAEIPDETAGPFPGDGSNGPDALAESGVVRSDIRSSIGDASGTAEGVPTTVELKLLDVAAGGTPLAGAAVYVWHCTRDGAYSMYDGAAAAENYLRGVQESDADGKLSFTTIFPGAYSGRWPHPLRGLRERGGGDLGVHQAQDVAAGDPAGRLRGRLHDRGIRAEHGQPGAGLARQRHGLQRRLREPARQLVRRSGRPHRAEVERRRLTTSAPRRT
jgi:protocatechuate 3,4-dioxygenase beta subunit